MPFLTVDTLRVKLTRLRHSGKKWREIGEEYPGVPLGTLCRIFRDDKYEPHKATIRADLGLPITVPVAVCAICGQPHIVKRPRHKKTFEQNCTEYDEWKQTNAAQINSLFARMVRR